MPWHSPYCCDWLKGICARLCACVNSTEKDGGRGQDLGLFLALSPFHHAERVVKDRMRAKEQQIDYPVCRKCVQGLCRETETKQRPHSGDALRHTRANVIIKQWRDGPLILCWYSKCWITPVHPNSALIWGLMCSSLQFPSCYVTHVLCAPWAREEPLTMYSQRWSIELTKHTEMLWWSILSTDCKPAV